MQTSFLQDLKTCWPCPSVSHEWRHQAVRARVSSAVRWAQMPPTLTVCCKISIWEFLEGTGTRWNSANGTDCLFSVVAHEKLLAHSVTCEKKPVQGKDRHETATHLWTNVLYTPQYTHLWVELNVCAHKHTKELPKKTQLILHIQIIPICASASCSNETKSLRSASDLKARRSSHHTETKQLARITHRASAPGGISQLHNIWKGFGSGHRETPMRFQGPLQGSHVSLGQALRICL